MRSEVVAGAAVRWVGIDFSGNVLKWRQQCSRSNVWVAELEDGGPLPRLSSLFRVQELGGDGTPFHRLAAYLKASPAATIAIDAPFSVPRAYLPPGGRDALLDAVANLDPEGRPFPRGDRLLDLVRSRAELAEMKPSRVTESRWRERGINVRSTLWNGPRGGAPFTSACLRLLGEAGRPPCWPWHATTGGGRPLLAEAFPAAQLAVWGLPNTGYDDDRRARKRLVEGLAGRVETPDPLAELALSSADALDAVVCAFAGVAVDRGRVAMAPEDPGGEGWIAVHG